MAGKCCITRFNPQRGEGDAYKGNSEGRYSLVLGSISVLQVFAFKVQFWK